MTKIMVESAWRANRNKPGKLSASRFCEVLRGTGQRSGEETSRRRLSGLGHTKIYM